MNISPAGIALIKRFEGCRLEAYKDVGGIPTIGYGHIVNVRMGDVITQEQADQWLMYEVGMFEHGVSDAVCVPLTQGQFDACVSLTFNIGGGNFVRSTLLKKINSGDWDGARREFTKWDQAAGKPVTGLLTRRMAEASMFGNASPVAGFTDAPLVPPEVVKPQKSGLMAIIETILSLFRK